MTGTTTTESTDTDARRVRRQQALADFTRTYRAMKAHRTHDTETEVVKALVVYQRSARQPDQEDFRKVYAFLERLAEDDLATWSELFRDAIEAGLTSQNAWHDLKRCHGDGSLQFVVMTRTVPHARGPEEVALSGDTRGLLGGMTDGLGLAPVRRHVLPDGTNVFLIKTA